MVPQVRLSVLVSLLLFSFSLICAGSAWAGLSGTPAKLILRKDSPPSQASFWKTKPALMKKIKEDRKIAVSVRKENVESTQLIRFVMQGAGWVNRSKDFSFQTAQRYHLLKEVSSHFRTVNFNPKASELFLVGEALGYQARMILKMTPVSEDWRSEIQFEVIWGHFKGMKGYIGFERINDRQTEVSIHANYEDEEWPLPRILMSFALEIITQRVAEKMRSFIEAQPALSSSPSASSLYRQKTGNDLLSSLEGRKHRTFP